jgi:UDP-GlcNAc:undecaprenyl-phosphate/decaprenyl-phosphate GlcNAc-1-phosphate transferase
MQSFIMVYIILSFLLLLSCAILSYKFKLIDKPNKRKIHFKPVAYTGGIAIIFSYLFALKFFNFGNDSYILSLILSISFLIAIIGFIDDKYNLNTGGKLSLQIVPIFYLLVVEKMSLTQIGDYEYFKLNLNTFSIPFTLICILFLINAFNYFDGADGTLSFSTISVISILYFLGTNDNIKFFLIIISIPICVFLCFNFSLFGLPKLFLGDSGSLLLGFILSFILILYANLKIVHPILLAWSIAIFVYEFLSINLERIIRKKNLFNAGQDHLHHLLLKKTKSIFLTNSLLFITNIILFIFGYTVFNFINPIASLILFITFFIPFYALRNVYLIKKFNKI